MFLGFAADQPPKLPPPFHTPSVNNPPRVIERPEGARLQVPQGFHIEEYATGFQRPRFMLLGPSNEVLLTDSTQKGVVHVLTNNGKSRKTLIEGIGIRTPTISGPRLSSAT